MSPESSRALAATFAGLGLMGALAACSAPADSSSEPTTGTTDGDSASTGTDMAYADGSYTADGSYEAPSGTESITVELTLADDTITAITVTAHATDPTAKGFQGKFVSGIADEVVGKDIDTLNVTRVSGSSLTSGGFEVAIEAIKEEAAA